MNRSPFPSQLRSLDSLLAVLDSARRVGIEICRMTGFISAGKGEVCLFHTGETPE